jgi:hypothetical protein
MNNKEHGGKRDGAGRPKIEGLKKRTTTATDAEWNAMLRARARYRLQQQAIKGGVK